MAHPVNPLDSRAEPQSAGAVLMVRPAHFAFNPQTASSNAFQAAGPDGGHGAGEEQAQALREFDALAGLLQGAGVEVIVADDSAAPVKPDAIFPNNWISFHCDGTVVLYPMLAENRRWERRQEVIDRVVLEGGYRIGRTVDLTPRELDARFLEGTGSLVLDRVHRVAYACRSPRTNPQVLGEFARLLGYEPAIFEAVDGIGRPIYHTNVLMAVGTGFAVLCSASIASGAQQAVVLGRVRECGHDIIDISPSQMTQFAGNLLELAPAAGAVIAMSQTAWHSFDAAQRRTLERHGGIVAADIPTIERLGGGGVRCMLAEIHLPKQS